MARKLTHRHDSKAVQGEGTWVELRKLTMGEMKRIGQDVDAEGNIPFSERKIRECVTAWNWTDEDGNALPIPSEDEAVLDALTSDEFDYLCKCIVGAGDRKN